MKTLYLVEKKEHVNDLLFGNRSDGAFIALGPGAAYELEKNAIAHVSCSDYLSREELQAICETWHAKTGNICDDLDMIFAQNNPNVPETISPFKFSVFPLILIIDGIVSRISYLKRVLAKTPVNNIFAHTSPGLSWGMFDILFSNNDNLWGKILELKGWDGLDKELKSVKTKKNTTWFDFRELLKKIVAAFTFKKPQKRGGFLYYGDLGEWAFVRKKFEENDMRIFRYRVKKDNYENYLKIVEQILSYHSKNKRNFICEGIDFFDLIAERLYWIWNATIIEYPRISEELGNIFDSASIKSVLSSFGGDLFSGIINSTAEKNSVPVIKWQHGFVFYNGRISQIADYKDLMNADHLFTYGKAAKEAYEKSLGGFSTKIHCVGSASLDNVKNRFSCISHKKSMKKTILYATTNYYQNNWYCGFYPPFIDMDFYGDQKKIIGWLFNKKKNNEAKVIIKLHPAKEYMDPPWVQDALKNNFCVIKNKKNFVELLKEADIIIIDSPTTTVLQAICTKKPVFVLKRHVSYSKEAGNLLAKRAVCLDDAAGLTSALDKFVESGIYTADTTNKEFLMDYGTHLDDGKSVERAFKEITRL